MQAGAWNRINERMLRACLDGLAEEGYCGEVVYHFEQRQVIRTVQELYLPGLRQPSSEARGSIEGYWPKLSYWLNHPDDTLMHIWFQRGKITKVQNRDRPPAFSRAPLGL
jgi:hypothetical protein